MGRRVWDKKDVNNFVSPDRDMELVNLAVDYEQLPNAQRDAENCTWLWRTCAGCGPSPWSSR